MTDLGVLPSDTSPFPQSYAFSVNDSGQIVGQASFKSPFTFYHAFLYTNGSIIDLNSLIDPSLEIVLTQAHNINNAGQILAEGISTSGNYVGNSFLLTPVPEPSAWVLCVGGLITFASVRRWRRGRKGGH